MLTSKQKKLLNKFLSLAPEPEHTLTYDEVLGYLFGLAMTPDIILPSEWIPVIFGGATPTYDSMEQAEELNSCLLEIYNTFTAAFHAKALKLPYNMANLKEREFESVYEWVSGLEEALSLRPDLWEPDEFPDLSAKKQEELFFSMMVIQGLVDPIEVMPFFENLPDEVFLEVFPDFQPGEDNKEAQIQAFLLVTLPLAIDTLQEHAQTIEAKRHNEIPRSSQPIPIRAAKTGRNDPCPCNSGKKYKKCCGAKSGKSTTPIELSPAASKSNVIQGNFPQHGKKSAIPAPIYQLKVGLHGAKPPIWRRIQVPGDITLFNLHNVIQLCMGWTDTHLHHFMIDRDIYGLPGEEDEWSLYESRDESQYTLRKLEKKIKPYFQYVYDFGDDWLHRITVEKVLKPEEGHPYPVLLTGKRTCPPEDIGGIHGYMHLLSILADPEDEEYQETMKWLGEDFHPEEFSKSEIAEINNILKNMFR